MIISTPITVKSALQNARDIEPIDRELLLAFILDIDRSMIIAHPERIISTRDTLRFQKLIERRRQHEPISYLIGHKEFYGRSFFVTHATLIPRPETEGLVEQIINHTQHETNVLFLDIGTGSGNIIITLAAELKQQEEKHFEYIALDRSQQALAIAVKNAHHHRLNNRIQFIYSNIFSKLPEDTGNSKEAIFIAANLPYLSKVRYNKTDEDVRDYEPKNALLAGEDGLDVYRKLLKQISQRQSWNKKRIFLITEIDPEQETGMRTIVSKFLPTATIYFEHDFSQTIRYALIKKPAQ